jgi:hypothetical protein
MSGSVLVAKAGRSGWLLLLSGLQFQVRAAMPLLRDGPCPLYRAIGKRCSPPRESTGWAAVDLAATGSPRRFGTSPATQPERGTVLGTQAASSRRPGERSDAS